MTGKTNTEKDNELLRLVFKDNEALLKLVRSLFFGLPLTDGEKELIKTSFANKDVREAMRNKVHGDITRDVPIGAEGDFWSGIESQIFGRDMYTVRQAVESKEKVLQMFNQAFDLLANPHNVSMDLSYDPITTDPLQIKLLARTLYWKAMTVALATYKVIAEQKDGENVQETAKRMQKDSMK